MKFFDLRDINGKIGQKIKQNSRHMDKCTSCAGRGFRWGGCGITYPIYNMCFFCEGTGSGERERTKRAKFEARQERRERRKNA